MNINRAYIFQLIVDEDRKYNKTKQFLVDKIILLRSL